MKIIIGTLLLCATALCDLPRGLRPPSKYHLYRAPITDLRLNSKLTIEQLINLTEKLQSRPHKNYGVPDVKHVENFDRQQLPYRPPTGFRQQFQQSTFGANSYQPQQNSFGGNGQNQPQQQYLSQNSVGENQYVPQQPQNSLGKSQFVPQPPQNSNSQQPQNSFGMNQYSPQQSSGINFNNQNQQRQPENSFGGVSINQNSLQQVSQYPPQQSQNSENSLHQAQRGSNSLPTSYLPTQTTPRSVVATTLKPSTTTATSTTTVEANDYDYNQQTEEGPNISVSNAVAGGGSFFYLQQPDGRLQKVILQKTQEPNSKPEEYVANYYFQNVQALPNTVYTPLINLGAYTQK
ncbi:unnamed protein product [Ceutorhynchus assimilis]|uniref:Enamelin n=1 Tax=Ceutorhynchus assimilis TaxID=467358 RepID=A0A9N9MFP3_9CUCU|nr:unnamed protein product [Ceutorhynchus assimilis]